MELTFAQKDQIVLYIVGNNIKTGEEMAIKLENVSNKHSQLLHEAKIYRILLIDGPVPGFPNLHWFEQEGDFNILVIDILGPSLEDFFNYYGKKFSLKSILMLADLLNQNIIQSFLIVINKNFHIYLAKTSTQRHQGRKFLIGLNKKSDNIYMIGFGFGLVKRYRYQRTETHIQYSEQNWLV